MSFHILHVFQHGATLTSNFISAVLETDGIILHCNESYQPCGVTAPLGRPIDEGNCARRYWQLYFPAIGWAATSRDRKEDTAPNPRRCALPVGASGRGARRRKFFDNVSFTAFCTRRLRRGGAVRDGGYTSQVPSAFSKSSRFSRREIISTVPFSSSQSWGARPMEL